MNLFRKPYQKLTDEQLMQKTASGDEKAFSELYDRYADKLLNYFFKMLWKDREMAEDYVQELFLKVIKKPEQFDETRTFKTWLYSIANNMCKNAYRHHEVVEKAAVELHANANSIDYQKTGTEHDLHAFRSQLDACLSRLDENKQLTFRLRYDEHCSIQEIAAQLECSEGTVKSRLFYALKFLNGELKGFKHLLKRD